MTGLVWAFDRCYSALGGTIRLRSEHRGLGTFVGGHLERFAIDVRPVPGRRLFSLADDPDHGEPALYLDRMLLANGGPAATALRFLREANRLFIEACPEFALHAAVVSNRDATICFPGESGTGKTTLTAAAVLRGFGYGSDEALAIRSDGTVVPYPKPLGLSPWTRSRLGIATPPGFDDDGEAPVRPGREMGDRRALTHLVVPIVESAGSPRLERIPQADVMRVLLRNSFNHYRHPRAAFEVASLIATTVTGLRIHLSDPLEAIDALEAAL